MRSELIIKSRSLGGATDLTLLAPIKPGMIPSLEAVTYKTRIKRLLRALNAGRSSSHEYLLLRAFSDAVDRVARIHSVRVAIVEPDQLLLSVTFDGGWESYLRILWQKVGTLLDVIFCNTEGYVSAWGHTFEEWSDWAHAVQIETDFFYGMPGHTVNDVQYLRDEEVLHRRRPGGDPIDLLAARHRVRSAEEVTWSLVNTTIHSVTREVGRQGLRALAFLYRLTGYYLPGTPEGDFLHRAARDILFEFVELDRLGKLDEVLELVDERFGEQVSWLRGDVPKREVPKLGNTTPHPDDPSQVQSGIISSYPDNITHGCLLLIAFGSKAGAAKFLDVLGKHVSREGTPVAKDEPVLTVGFTLDGLRALGLSEPQIAYFPQEFRQGMEARASVLGDARTNHPRRWRLPLRNWERSPSDPRLAVEMSSIHAVVQMRIAEGPASTGDTLDESDPLYRCVEKLLHGHDVELLSVQPMVRYRNEEGVAKGLPREHFGFTDGDSQPVLAPPPPDAIYKSNQVQLGEFLMGYDNEAEFPQDPDLAQDPDFARERGAWLRNGSFLVIRKFAQDVEALEAAVDPKVTGLPDKELALAKMMGRWRNGIALAAKPGKGNDFDYSSEPSPGSQCPFHAHIRRANPRLTDDLNLPVPPPGRRTPRIVRRGMSYGPLYDPKEPGSGERPRGMIFMAYNASIAEQFEVVQNWVSGGNSAGGFSGQSDPFLGVTPNGERKHFRFEHNGVSHKIALDGSDDAEAPFADRRPFVRLEWGTYLFTPSISTIERLADVARQHSDAPEETVWSVADGWRRVQDLLDLEKTQGAERASEAWKALLEDPEALSRFDSAGVWAALRRHCGGVLRTPYGVIVADRDLVAQVLANRDQTYSMIRHHGRMTQSIGEIYLGLDDHGEGCRYREQSSKINDAIMSLKKDETFGFARTAAAAAFRELIDWEIALATGLKEPRWELNLDLKEVIEKALEALCRHWFGLPLDECEIRPGGVRWDWTKRQAPTYPGHFTAPSRYIFQPRPGQSVEGFGCEYGQALRQAFSKLIKRHRDASTPVFDPKATLTKAILKNFPRRDPHDPACDDPAARQMVGALMGFLPTVDGNLRQSLNEMLRDGSFWSLRTALAECNPAKPLRNAERLIEPWLKRTMQLRPAPELIWRTAMRHDSIGHEPVGPGDRLVLGLVSATQQCLESRKPGAAPDVYPVFGGNRRAPIHPTHACPGYDAAMGAMLGIISALLEVKEAMRPSIAAFALTLEGNLPVIRRPTDRLFQGGKGKGRQVGAGHTLVAGGDSWFCYRESGDSGPELNIAECLRVIHGFEVISDPSFTSTGNRLRQFYNDRGNGIPPEIGDKPNMRSTLLDSLIVTVNRTKPTAILFSAAGNDVVKKARLMPLLLPNKPGEPPLDRDVVEKTVDKAMRSWLELILDRITTECVSAPGVPIPVFLHGYAYPVPDGRYVFEGPFFKGLWWLYPSFEKMKYLSTPYTPYPKPGVDIMRTLIERLNSMQKVVAGLPRFKGHVFHVDLTKTLSNGAADYTDDWINELHATEKGFTLLGQVFADALVANIQSLKLRS